MSTALFLSVFQQLVAFSHELSLPTSFANDLFVHDRAFLQANPNAVFVWVLYKSGTHVVRVSPVVINYADGVRYRNNVPVSTVVRQVHSAFEEDGAKLFFVDCRYNKVTPCTLEECLALVTAYVELEQEVVS